jgi:hypothetical protein
MRRMRLVEQLSGTGELIRNHQVLQQARYSIRVYQKMLDGHPDQPMLDTLRIEGTLDSEYLRDTLGMVGEEFTLRLNDGRCLDITVLDHRGKIAGRGRGPYAEPA